MSQMKKQGKNLQNQLYEEEIGNLPEKEFRVMIVKMIQNLRNTMEVQIQKIQEMFNISRRSRRTKEKTTRDEQHNNWNEKYTRKNQ